jgi:hypothetical protein
MFLQTTHAFPRHYNLEEQRRNINLVIQFLQDIYNGFRLC